MLKAAGLVQSDLYKVESYTLNVHSKYLLLDDGSGEKFVWTGSLNYTVSALRNNDEALLRIESDTIHAAYDKNFDEMLAAGPTRMRPPAPTTSAVPAGG